MASTSSGQHILNPYDMQIGVLDFEPRKINLELGNPILETWRLNACAKEPWTAEFVGAIPSGSVFYDIGACVGSYSLITATAGINTVAIEPSTPNVQAIVKNGMLNNCLEHMLILPVALGSQRCLAWLDYQDVRPGAASHNIGSGEKIWNHRQRVQVWPLDELCSAFNIPVPTHLKLDVDGGESEVLAGMDQVLRHERLIAMMVEMPTRTEQAILDHLGERGWQMAERFDHRGDITIQGVCYGRFERVAVPAEAPVKVGRGGRKKESVPA